MNYTLNKEYLQLRQIKTQFNLKVGKDLNGYFSKGQMQMSNKYIKICSTSLFIRELEIKKQ